METVTPNLKAEIYHQKVALCLVTRLARQVCHESYQERLLKLNIFLLEYMCIHIDLIPAFKIFKGEIDVSPSYFFGRPPLIELLGTRTTGYGKPPLTEERYTF